MRYLDRQDAGRRLAPAVQALGLHEPLVVGLARGGVLVAAEVARTLGTSLDVMVARKLGAPSDPEFAIGAVAPGVVHLEPFTEGLHIPAAYLERAVARERETMAKLERLYRGRKAALAAMDRDVVLVDDGLATGATAVAAVLSLRLGRPRSITLAAPVADADSIEALRHRFDGVVCPFAPVPFGAVGDHYVDFSPVPDDAVHAALKEFPAY